MGEPRFRATYLIETAYPLADAAAALAGEQSTGTFIRLPGETDELLERHAARVEAITEVEPVPTPSLPGAGRPKGADLVRRARVTISWPLATIGPSLPNLMATVAGNLFELKQFSGVRLLDLDLPPAFAEAYPGPQFGVAGTRALAGVEGRPLVGTIIKPSVGLSPAETAALVDTLCEGGIDFIKDDELQANGPHCPLADRVRAVMPVIDRHAQRTGRKVMYAFNITDDLDAMLRHHDTVLAAGGTCVMVSLNSCGLVGLSALRRHSRLPIHAHRNGWGYLSRSPALGFEYAAWQKVWRVAGVDHMHVNGLRNKFSELDASVIASARTCLAPMFAPPAPGFAIMPVFSSGQWAGQAPDTFRMLGSVDLIYACGGGIVAHPGGVAAGVASIRQAWEAAVSGQDLHAYAETHAELRQALDQYGAA
ncbi:ribulose-bisphosphate carboxylase large subunit family protein [Azospirillum sp.]|uniref:ribulose-bisphosphate carboxylase large subunit family protein n=1 Tax=Azospirillum sp. TaxID=34012 RepID=UPI003D730048